MPLAENEELFLIVNTYYLHYSIKSILTFSASHLLYFITKIDPTDINIFCIVIKFTLNLSETSLIR